MKNLMSTRGTPMERRRWCLRQCAATWCVEFPSILYHIVILILFDIPFVSFSHYHCFNSSIDFLKFICWLLELHLLILLILLDTTKWSHQWYRQCNLMQSKDVVEYLVERRANVDAQDGISGWTALMQAIYYGMCLSIFHSILCNVPTNPRVFDRR